MILAFHAVLGIAQHWSTYILGIHPLRWPR